jgi:probable F420-dependent oxidoreductase
MHVGVVFPQVEIEPDPDAIAGFATGIEALGYDHVVAYDHVVGADPAVHDGWDGFYDVTAGFHEPMVLFGFLAGITTRLELVTGILILPQRQTVLVAKQAAALDVLARGRLRLGVGLGWNPVEYEALGRSFKNRGARIGEQVDLLRRLWPETSLTHSSEHERITGAGIAPLPVQRPIPVWFGAWTAPAFRRAGRYADGWFPQLPPGPDLDAALAQVRAGAVEAGRDPSRIAMEGRVSWGDGGVAAVLADLERWEVAGATHVSIYTMRFGLDSAAAHLDVLGTIAAAREG